ncbi:MAG TPA: HAD family hydrolase [Rhodocyclaceae bacterium]|nr:HAD family hydrolase [Rhodocyclaceae bacterium]
MRAGILLDLDETLIDRTASITRFAAKLWRRHALAECEEDFIAHFLRLDARGTTPRPEFFRQLCETHLPMENSRALMEEFLDTVWAEPLLFPYVIDSLQKLRAAGFMLGIVSNGSTRPQTDKILNSPLHALVDDWFISEALGVRKPEPAIFRHAIEHLRLDMQNSWFIGDCPFADIVGAHGVGLRCVWLSHDRPWPEKYAPCYTQSARNLAEAVDLIARPSVL